MSIIYVISGSTGEYSDRCEWLVEAHSTEAAAQARVTQLHELMQELGVTDASYKTRDAAIEKMRTHTLGDSNFSIFYGDTGYSYAECELVSQ